MPKTRMPKTSSQNRETSHKANESSCLSGEAPGSHLGQCTSGFLTYLRMGNWTSPPSVFDSRFRCLILYLSLLQLSTYKLANGDLVNALEVPGELIKCLYSCLFVMVWCHGSQFCLSPQPGLSHWRNLSTRETNLTSRIQHLLSLHLWGCYSRFENPTLEHALTKQTRGCRLVLELALRLSIHRPKTYH